MQGIAMATASSGTRAKRYEYGVGLRRKTPREKHADLQGSKNRDPVAILAAGERARLPVLVPLGYQRILISRFTYLRGAASVMAADLQHQPSAGIAVQA